MGYAEASGLPYEMGLIKNKYIGRTFIQPSQSMREKGVRMKLSSVSGIVSGQRVVLIDDSIVRGTTSRRIVRLLREAGATEVHVRIASPPFKNPCFYGVDTSTYEELLCARMSVPEACEYIGADSLAYLSPDALLKAGNRCELCMPASRAIIRRRFTGRSRRRTKKKNVKQTASFSICGVREEPVLHAYFENIGWKYSGNS